MEDGRLTDGAVYLPEIRGGEMVVSDGADVDEGICNDSSGGSWSWKQLQPLDSEDKRGSMISISQDMAREGTMTCSNPIQALGCAVLPLVGLLQGRFLAYVGKLKLWDLAGCLPLLERHGFSISHFEGDPPRRLTLEVNESHYEMDPTHPVRWGIKGGLLACPKSKEQWVRDCMR